jgi:phospholipase/carboxylesterase
MPLRVTTTTLGPLRAHVVDDSDREAPPSLVVILCHGFGAPGDDLVSLGPELCALSPTIARTTRFIFPEAPIALDGVAFGGRAWWPIDMMALQMAMARGLHRQLADESPEGLPSARQKLTAMIEVVLRDTGLPMSRVVLGGFSQGAMLATDTTLHLDEAPAGLCVLSGTLLQQHAWRRLAPRRVGLRVIQSHGRRDPILPFDGALALQQLLTDAGLVVDFFAFDGGHGIDGDALQAIADFVSSL